MRTSAMRRCASCDAAWDADRARFCGACGASLAAAAAARREPRSPSPRLAGAAAAVVVVLGAFAVGGSTFRLPARGADPTVELDPETVPLGGEPLTDAERAEALAPFDADRLRCEPEGCERWRVDLPGGSPRATVVGDEVIVVVGHKVLALDRDSGERRWGAVWPSDADSAPPATDRHHVSVGADGLVVVTWFQSGHALAITRGGEVAWHAEGLAEPNGWVSAIGEVVVVHSPSDRQVDLGGDGTVFMMLNDLAVRDPATGVLLWEAEARALRGVVDGALLVHDGTSVQLLDARTGRERARRELSPQGWFQVAGDVLVYVNETAADAWQLLDAETLGHVADIDPLDLLQPDEGGEVLVGQVRGDRDTGDRILVFEPDGTLRWEHELSVPAGSLPECCTRPQVTDGALVLPPVAGGSGPLRLRLDDGGPLPEAPPVPGGARAPEADPETYWTSPHTAVTTGPDGDAMVWHDGYRMAIRGGTGGPEGFDPPLVFTDRHGVVAVQPVPRD